MKPRPISAAFLLLLTSAVLAQTAPITVRVSVDCWSSPTACKINSGKFGGLTDDYSYLPTQTLSPHCTTYSQLPFASRVQTVTAESYLFDASSSDPASLVTVYLNGIPLGAPQAVTNSPTFGCHGYATSKRYDFQSPTTPEGFSGYNVRGANSVQIGTGSQQAAVELVDLVVTYLPPRNFDFDPNEFTPKSERTILISKQRNDDTYTSPRQLRDREIPIVVRVNGPTGPVPGQTVYFKVNDPPSEAVDAPYAFDRRQDDNDDSAGGVLTGANITQIGPDRVSAVSDFDGYVRMTLTVTNYAAGDNYQIEASADSSFTCPNGCDKSGVITAWKRIYVESDRMFRAGTFLTRDFSPCTAEPCPTTSILHVQNTDVIGRATRLRLLHGPRFSSPVRTAYFEDVSVVRVSKPNKTIEVSRVNQPYFGPEENPFIVGRIEPFLADAVGVISAPAGNDADFFLANTINVSQLMTPSFVETVWLTNDPVPFVPFSASVLGAGVDSDQSALTALKWFHHANVPNHEHVLAGRQGRDAVEMGITRARLGANWSWIWVQSVIDHAPRRGNREWALNGEVTAHEVAHLWQVNPAVSVTGGHCGTNQSPTSPRAWNNAQLFCVMQSPYDSPNCGGGTCPEFYDGIVAFHYNGTSSEHIDIRRRPDPLPHN
jgi:hypothetical protein